MTGEDLKYYAFISYSHKDERWARWLHRAIESYRMPGSLVGQETLVGTTPARLNPVFRDRDELPTASDLGEVIRDAISGAHCLIVICSPEAVQSRWVEQEILAFKRLGREGRILCLIVDGEPNSGGHTECFPKALRYKIGPDGELTDEPTEPIAADARPGGDGRNASKLKLLAGMLGVGYDTLRQRELHRRHRRMAAVSVAAVTGMVITTGLAAAALFARSEAEDQRRLAQAQAETSRQTAGFLIDLFKVSDPSEALGNTITAREILDKGASRIEAELADQPLVQARLMATMGSVYQSLGLYGDAGDLLEGALAIRRDTRLASERELADSLAGLGQLRSLTADYDAAAQSLRDAIGLYEGEPEPDVPALADAYAGLGEVLTYKGDFAGAEPLYEKALNMHREVYGADHLTTAHSVELLALNRMDLGRLAEAEALFREALATVEKLVGEAHPQLADLLSNLAFVLLERGRIEEAQALAERSLAMNRELLGESHPTLAININNVAFLAHQAGRFERAEALFREVIDMHSALLSAEHPEVADALMNLAMVQYESGQVEAAFETGADSLALFRQVFPEGHPEVARVLTNLGSWRSDRYDYREAEALLLEALDMKASLLDEEHLSLAFTRAPLARVYLATGRAGSAFEQAALAYDSFASALPAGHWRTAWAMSMKGSALADQGQLDAAGPLLEQAYRSLTRNPDARDTALLDAREYLGSYYRRIGRNDLADALAVAGS